MARRTSVSTRKRSRYLLGVALVCWCGATGLFGSALYDSAQRWQILHSSLVQANVVKLFGIARHGQMTYYLGVGFVDTNGTPQLSEVPVTKRQFEQTLKGSWVSIRYRPSHPADALLASDSVLRLRNAGALLAALGLYAAGQIRWRRWQREQLKQS